MGQKVTEGGSVGCNKRVGQRESQRVDQSELYSL